MGVKNYDRSFKERAVNGSGNAVAKELGRSSSQLTKWRKEFEAYGQSSFPGHRIERLTDEQREIKKWDCWLGIAFSTSENCIKSLCL